MEMPKVNEHHKRLHALVGQWKGQEKIFPSPWNAQSSTTTSRSTARMDLGGFFLVMDYVQESNGQESFRGHGVYGWDPRQQKYTMHWFDVMGGDPGAPPLGTFEGNTLCFQHQHHCGHSRYTYIIDGPDAYTFRLENSKDGVNWTPFMEGKYQRV